MMDSVHPPTPALVTRRAAQRLPRIALLLLCAAYLLPGLFGRDPWRNADLTAFAYMQSMAQGSTPWLTPTLGDLPAETALLPHWLGALAIRALPWLDAALAARLPFAALLALTLALVWYATFHLARTDAAQPIPFAFGGEPSPTDYARALADGSLLATIASLGLLQLGHETTPELVQLCGVAAATWALSAAPHRPRMAPLALVVSLVGLASSGAPSIALVLGLVAWLSCHQSRLPEVRRLWPAMLAATVAAAFVATLLGAWKWRLTLEPQGSEWLGFVRLLVWFTWPTLPLAAWTLWRWRGHLSRRHLSTPAAVVAVVMLGTVLTGGSDRSLLLCLPGLAILAAFALPTLQRGAGAAMDWFSVFFFSVSALTIWVIYLSMQTGWPPHPMRNLHRLAPDFQPSFSGLALCAAATGTLAWLWLVRWRTSRHREALWKSLVLPASGVALAWLLTMTLLLPPLDHGRSPRPLVARLQALIPAGSCVLAPDLGRANIAALTLFGPYTVHAAVPLSQDPEHCRHLLLQVRPAAAAALPMDWRLIGTVERPGDRNDRFLVLVRSD